MDTGCSPIDLKGPDVSLGIKPEMVTKKLNPYASVIVLGMGRFSVYSALLYDTLLYSEIIIRLELHEISCSVISFINQINKGVFDTYFDTK